MKGWNLRISPRRAALGGLILLIPGAVTTVAVAWGLALRGGAIDDDFFGGKQRPRDYRYWIADDPVDHVPVPLYEWTGRRPFEVLKCVIHVNPEHNTPESWAARSMRGAVRSSWPEWVSRDALRGAMTVIASGWPYRAVSGRVGFEALAGSEEGAEFRSTGLLVIESTRHARDVTRHVPERAVPLHPIWPGFLIDTLFYAAIWLGILFGFASARRALRRRRGRCPKCSYDLHGELYEGCPECGWARH